MTWSKDMMDQIRAGTHNGIGHGVTQTGICPRRGRWYRVKAWHTVDEDGHRRPQYYPENDKLELNNGFWQPKDDA